MKASSFQKAQQLPHESLLQVAQQRFEEYKQQFQDAREQWKDIKLNFTCKFPRWYVQIHTLKTHTHTHTH
jgi:hypothetical protein